VPAISTPASRAPRSDLARPSRMIPGQAPGITAVSWLPPKRRVPGPVIMVDGSTANRSREVENSPTCGCPPTRCSAEVDRGMEVAQTFLHENRIRQPPVAWGADQYASTVPPNMRDTQGFSAGHCRANQACGPLASCRRSADGAAVVHAAWHLGPQPHREVSDKVSMAHYRANRMVAKTPPIARCRSGAPRYPDATSRSSNIAIATTGSLPDHRGRRRDPDPPSGPPPCSSRRK